MAFLQTFTNYLVSSMYSIKEYVDIKASEHAINYKPQLFYCITEKKTYYQPVNDYVN